MLRGEVVTERLGLVRKNTWNHNEMTPHERESLRAGLRDDGWLVSHALLVWGKDERGATQNVDGEHRWAEATALGFEVGPMVFLDGITQAEAMALTVKLTERRGHSNDVKLGALLRGLPVNLLSATSLGLDVERLARLTKVELPESRGRSCRPD